MPASRKFRIYGVTVDDTTTRAYAVPEFEINVLRAAWRGKNITVSPTGDTRDIDMDAGRVWTNLRNRYQAQALLAYYPGPERLADDMERAADKTDEWLKDRAKWQEQEDERVRKLIAASRTAADKPAEQKKAS